MTNESVMNSWKQITSEAQWEEIAESCDYFEDGTFRELGWTGGEYVDSNLRMLFPGRPALWLLVQAQNAKAPTIEFRLEEVVEIHLDHRHEPEFKAVFEEGEVLLELSGAGSRIRGARLFYRIPDPPLLGETGVLRVPE